MTPLPGWLRGYPGAVVQLSSAGTVQQSNGRLETLLGVPAIVGCPFTTLLDEGPTRGKWGRMMQAAAAAGPPQEGDEAPAAPIGWELILCAGDTPLEPRRFSLLPDPDGPALWLIEHPDDSRIDVIREAVTEVNATLVQTQRELVRERARLAATAEELERSNRALDEFAHAVSHDLRAPLRSLAHYCRWIEEDLGEAAGPAAEHLAGLASQVARMQGMIEGVLRFARAGRLEAQPEPVDVGALVADVGHMLAPPPGIRITGDAALPTLVTERAPLLQVLLNLVGNAVAHGGEAVRVHVSAEDRGAATEFVVADTGPGVPPALRDRVWGLFQTGAGGAEAKGTGIGLALVKRLVEDRGGRTWIDEAPGGGATFRFTWPKQPVLRSTSGI